MHVFFKLLFLLPSLWRRIGTVYDYHLPAFTVSDCRCSDIILRYFDFEKEELEVGGYRVGHYALFVTFGLFCLRFFQILVFTKQFPVLPTIFIIF